jgi:hypothetical protein
MGCPGACPEAARSYMGAVHHMAVSNAGSQLAAAQYLLVLAPCRSSPRPLGDVPRYSLHMT